MFEQQKTAVWANINADQSMEEVHQEVRHGWGGGVCLVSAQRGWGGRWCAWMSSRNGVGPVLCSLASVRGNKFISSSASTFAPALSLPCKCSDAGQGPSGPHARRRGQRRAPPTVRWYLGVSAAGALAVLSWLPGRLLPPSMCWAGAGGVGGLRLPFLLTLVWPPMPAQDGLPSQRPMTGEGAVQVAAAFGRDCCSLWPAVLQRQHRYASS